MRRRRRHRQHISRRGANSYFHTAQSSRVPERPQWIRGSLRPRTWMPVAALNLLAESTGRRGKVVIVSSHLGRDGNTQRARNQAANGRDCHNEHCCKRHVTALCTLPASKDCHRNRDWLKLKSYFMRASFLFFVSTSFGKSKQGRDFAKSAVLVFGAAEKFTTRGQVPESRQF